MFALILLFVTIKAQTTIPLLNDPEWFDPLKSTLTEWGYDTDFVQASDLAYSSSYQLNNYSDFSESQLVGLHLPSVGLQGHILPTYLFLLTSLTSLDLTGNALTHTLSSQLGLLTNLRSLLLARNDVFGVIPSQLGALTQLTQLSLRRNLLFGSLPTQLAQLTQLQSLLVFGNRLSGTVPANLTVADECLLSCPLDVCSDGDDNCFQCPLPDSLPLTCYAHVVCGECVALAGFYPQNVQVEYAKRAWIAPLVFTVVMICLAVILLLYGTSRDRDFSRRMRLANA